MPLKEEMIFHIAFNEPFTTHNFKCGHCGREAVGRVVSIYGKPVPSPASPKANPAVKFLLCPSCEKGSVWNENIIIPGSAPTRGVDGLSSELAAAYKEAQDCFSVGAYTGCSLLCRKIIMYVAADKGALEGKSFEFYLDYLVNEGHITKSMKNWVDKIRTFGNEATHKLSLPNKELTEGVLKFTQILLTVIFENTQLADKFGK